MKPIHTTRFLAAAIICTSTILHAESFTKGREEKPLTPQLKAGDYVWKPEVSPSGPVVIIVSIPEQTLYVYRNGIRIGRSTVSTGKSGHRTPTGVFTILEKNVKHNSSIYKGASMPYMERLTWGGVAMHAGNLPGYPASHGCVRLPLDFAQKLYTVTSNGSTVIVTDAKAAPGTTSNPGLLLSGKTGEASSEVPQGEFIWKPEKSPSGPVSILFSSADREAYVYRNGVEIGRASIGGDAGKITGNYAFSALEKVNSDGSHDWQALGSADGTPAPDLKALEKHAVIPLEFLAQARSLVTPGTTLIVTDQPVNRATHSAPGFNILTTQVSPK
ncbi:MAG TPA: L,D-transpeptidase [Chthoniobacter sp.]|nr:L,D-transpeptidase [Chthoniobacter sp.]